MGYAPEFYDTYSSIVKWIYIYHLEFIYLTANRNALFLNSYTISVNMIYFLLSV